MKAKMIYLAKEGKNEEESRKTRDEKTQKKLDKKDLSNYANEIDEKKNDNELLLNNSNKVKGINYYLERLEFKILKLLKMLFLFFNLLFVQKEKTQDKNDKELSDRLSYLSKVYSSYYNINKLIVRNISEYNYNNKDVKLIKEEKINNNNNSGLRILAFEHIKKIIKFILLLNLINKMESKILFPKKISYNNTEITLKIDEIGTQKILNDWLDDTDCPSLIKLNGEDQNLAKCTEISINTPGSIVTLIWNEPIIFIDCLFCHCENILEINIVSSDIYEDIFGLFAYCYSLISANLSFLNTENVYSMDAMFYECHSIKSINLGNFNTSQVSDFEYMFYNCYNLEYINLENFTDPLDYNPGQEYIYTEMFTGIAKNVVICIHESRASSIYNLISDTECITISCDPDWRSVQKKINNDDTNQCVEDCNTLTFNQYEYEGKCYSSCPENTNNYENKCYTNEGMCNLFSTCTSCSENKFLKKGKCVDSCEKGYFLDKNNPAIKKCKCDIIKCEECSEESILSNLCLTCNKDEGFYPKSNDEWIFIECYDGNISGYYFDNDAQNYKECYSSCQTCKGEGNDTNHNCLLCADEYNYELTISETINCYQICEYYSYYNTFNKKNYCTFDNSCPKDFNKLILDKRKCINDCTKDNEYRYEFRKTCYKECPPGISEKSKTVRYKCEAICNKDYPFEIIETQECVNKCTIEEREKGICKISYEEKDKENKEAEEKAVENIKEELTNGFNTSNIDNGKDAIIKQKGSTITISTTDNQKKNKASNTTTIDLGECETKIKEEYNISIDKPLYILKIDVKQEGYQIPKIAYEVYYPLFGDNLIKLNLTVCQDIKIDISIPIKLSGNLDKVNPNSEYYTDICYTETSEDGTDISLSDRKQNFVSNNLSVCEEDCDFVAYNEAIGKAKCSCEVKTDSSTKISDIVVDKNKLLNSFTNFKNIANVKVLKCIKSIFKLDAYKNNYGNLIMIVIILLLFITLIIFFCKDYYNIKKLMDLIVYFKTHPLIVKIFIKKRNQTDLNDEKDEKTPEKRTQSKNSKYLNKKENKENNNNIKNLKINNDVKLGINNNNKKNNNNNLRNIIYDFIKNRNTSRVSWRTNRYHGNNGYIKNNKINKKGNSNPVKRRKNNKSIKNQKDIYNNINNEFIIPKKKNLIKKENKDNIININKTNEEKDINKNQEDFPYEMKEKQMYEMFLKIYNQTDNELNDLDYEKALQFDYRTYTLYYISLIRTNHLFFFSFWPRFDYNSRIIKIFLFFFNFAVSFATNSLFFDDETMHKIYEEKGAFNFMYNIPQIFLSSLISGFIIGLIQNFAL